MSEFDVVTYSMLRATRRVSKVRETPGSAASSNSTWVTLVSITGAGWLYAIRVASPSGSMRVTIDGVLIGSGGLSGVFGPFVQSASEIVTCVPMVNGRFNSSVLVEYMNTSATAVTGKGNVVWGMT